VPDDNTLFERTCRGERGPRMPVWIMRQAGRYLPEYRKVRETVDFLTATKTPELAAAITMQPMARFPLDAAILFSDIMTPLEGMGVALTFDPGPVLERPIRSAADARQLRALDPEEATPFVLETLRLVRAELSTDRALIGFAGAPFTLFCYLVQGQGSRDFMEARSFLRGETEAAVALLDLLGASTVDYLVAQADAGADAIMLFDSWVGLLGPDSYRRFVLPLMQSVVARIRSRVDRPIIYFANGAGTMVDDIGKVGADVVGIDWTLPLSRAVDQLGPDAVVQGNLDPAALFAPPDELDTAIRSVIDEGSRAAGHIFNLGHGIHRTTDPDRVAFLVDRVHEYSAHT
jgi:uroporphyrinogen decarboxylase